jgi:hypothetical protein
MDTREPLIRMLKQLVEDMQILRQQGAGYYSCIPISRRYNKLLEHARLLFAGQGSLIDTFDALPEDDPKDPGDKMAVVQGIRIEIGQLITLLEATKEDTT